MDRDVLENALLFLFVFGLIPWSVTSSARSVEPNPPKGTGGVVVGSMLIALTSIAGALFGLLYQPTQANIHSGYSFFGFWKGLALWT
ncbi:MAG: hypothetical protein LC733_05265, partial [Actinobacteria bacterium]|nr:hypothetical protein [Actinomycetota bacterium]